MVGQGTQKTEEIDQCFKRRKVKCFSRTYLRSFKEFEIGNELDQEYGHNIGCQPSKDEQSQDEERRILVSPYPWTLNIHCKLGYLVLVLDTGQHMRCLTLLVFGSRMHLVELQLDKLGTRQCWCQVCMIVLGSSSFSLLSKLACKCNGFDLDKKFGKSLTGYESSGSQYPLSVSDVLGVLLCKAWTVVDYLIMHRIHWKHSRRMRNPLEAGYSWKFEEGRIYHPCFHYDTTDCAKLSQVGVKLLRHYNVVAQIKFILGKQELTNNKEELC